MRRALLQLAIDESWSVRKLALLHLPRVAALWATGGDLEAISVVLDRALDPIAEVRRVALETLPALTDRKNLEFPYVLRRLLALMNPKELLASSEVEDGTLEASTSKAGDSNASEGYVTTYADSRSASAKLLQPRGFGFRMSRELTTKLREQVSCFLNYVGILPLPVMKTLMQVVVALERVAGRGHGGVMDGLIEMLDR